jgi:hypothetical protein
MTPESELAVYSALSRHVMPSLLILSEIFLFLTFLLHVLVTEFRKPIFGEFPEFRKPIFGEFPRVQKTNF